jgi:hypothetical protein
LNSLSFDRTFSLLSPSGGAKRRPPLPGAELPAFPLSDNVPKPIAGVFPIDNCIISVPTRGSAF